MHCTPSEIRTHTDMILNHVPLPIGLPEQLELHVGIEPTISSLQERRITIDTYEAFAEEVGLEPTHLKGLQFSRPPSLGLPALTLPCYYIKKPCLKETGLKYNM